MSQLSNQQKKKTFGKFGCSYKKLPLKSEVNVSNMQYSNQIINNKSSPLKAQKKNIKNKFNRSRKHKVKLNN